MSAVVDTSKHEGLGGLAGFPFPVLASSGTEPTARTIATRTARAYSFLGEVLSTTPEIALLVLSPADWAPRTTIPYGVANVSKGNLIVPGETGDAAWRELADLLLGARADVIAAARRVYGTPVGTGGALDLGSFWDLLSIHELGHAFSGQANVRFRRKWLGEFFANLCLHAYVATVEPDLLPALETLPRLVVGLGGGAYAHHSLAEFEDLYFGVGKMNYFWYQFHLQVEVKHVFDAMGLQGMQRLFAAFRLPRGSAPEGTVSRDQLVDQLHQQVHPRMAQVLTDWPGLRS